MVIRKPFAFLIKNFKIIHFIIFGILFYLFFKSYSIHGFLSGVASGSLNRHNSINYISYIMIIVTVVLILLFVIIYFLMKYKEKPKLIYLISIIGYILFLILIIFTFSYFKTINSDLVDQKIIRLYRDLFRFMLVFEIIITLFMLVRALGFDIKKFDFNKDLYEMDISLDDSEEIEVSLEVNTNPARRFSHHFGRNMEYYYKENRLVISIILVIVIIICFYSVGKFILNNRSYANVGEYFSTNRFNVKINNTFVTSYNDLNDNLNNYYLIVSFNIKGITDEKNSIDSTSLKLKLGGKTYYPILNKCKAFTNFGGCYKYKTISNKTSNDYILVYDIDDDDIDKKASFIFDYGYADKSVLSYVVKFKAVNFDSKVNSDYTKGEVMPLDIYGFNNETFSINDYEFGFEFNYGDNMVISSDKIILRLDVKSSYDINNLLNKTVYIGYNDRLLNFNILLIYDNYVFLELDKDISASESIWVDFRNRGYIYKYYLVK